MIIPKEDILAIPSGFVLTRELINNDQLNFALNNHYQALDGKAKIGHVTRIQIADTDWFLVSEVDRAKVMRSVYENMAITLTVMFFLLFFVAYLAKLKARSFIIPIHQLLGFARSVAKKGYANNIELDTNDELSELAYAFKEMLDAQKQTREVIRRKPS